MDEIIEDKELGTLVIRVNARARSLVFRTKNDAIYVSVPPGTTSADVTNAIDQLRVKLRGLKEKVVRPLIDLNYHIDTEYFRSIIVKIPFPSVLSH